jgi:outer membrane biosynthesis protein TonB
LGLRLSLAKDSDDQAKWEGEYAYAREVLASSQVQIASLGGVPPLRPAQGPNKISSASPYSTKKVSETVLDIKAPDKSDASAAPEQQPAKENDASQSTPKSAEPKPDGAGDNDAGSLNAFATRKVLPRYPPIAKQSGAAGLVRVHVIVEGGKVISVSRSEGPMLLRSAAEEAARQWSFQLVSVEGRPMRLSGYIDFNFTL